MDKRIKLNYVSKTSRNADIIYYISTDNFQELTKIINEANVNEVVDTKNGYTALHYASKTDNTRMIEYLLRMGANPYLTTNDNKNSFDITLKHQNKVAFVYELNEVKSTNSILKQDISALEKKYSTIDNNNKYLIKSIDDLVVKNDKLKKEITDVKQVNEELKGVRDEIIVVKNDNERLKRKYSSLEESFNGVLKTLRK